MAISSAETIPHRETGHGLHIAKTPHVDRKRSVTKAVSWRALGSIDTFVIAFIATGEIKTGAFIVSAEMVTKMILYYLHERGWAHIRWGLK